MRRIEQAHTGTLFLDEIANLDLESQRRLLLVLERGTVTRLGDSRPRSAAPKLVAATHADLADLVSEGRFRQDLYMRLNPATRLRVPPLRERREDLPDLIRFALLDALRSEQLRPLVRAYLARFPTPDDYAEEKNSVHFGKPQGRAQRRDAFSIFVPQGALTGSPRTLGPATTRVEAAGDERAGVLAGPAPRRGRPPAARSGEGGSSIRARAGRARHPGCASGPLARQARRAAASGARTRGLRIHGDRRVEMRSSRRELRGDLRRGGASIPDGAVPCARRRPGPDGAELFGPGAAGARCTCA